MFRITKLRMETIPLFLVAVIVVFTLIYINNNYVNAIIDTQISEEYIQIIENKHDYFDDMISQMLFIINSALYREEALDLISGSLSGYEKSLVLKDIQQSLQYNRGSEKEYELFYYGFNGVTFIKNKQIFTNTTNFEETEWYRLATETDEKLYWFGVKPEETTINFSFIGSSKINISDFKKGNFSGLVFFSINKYTMDKILKNTEGITYIVNKDGIVLYNSDNNESGFSLLSVIDVNYIQDINETKYNVKTIEKSLLLNTQKIAVISPWDYFGFSVIHVREQLSIINKYESLKILYYIFLFIVLLLSLYYYFIFLYTVRKPLRNLFKKILDTDIRKGNIFDKNPVSTGIKRLDDEFNRIIKTNIINIQRIDQIEKTKQLMHIKKLQAEIDPHFLYNVLSHIKFAINLDEPIKIITIIDSLFVILNSKKGQVDSFTNVKKEIEILQNYIDIIKIIYQDHIVFEITIEPAIENCQIPSFILQPIVENCVHHALDPSKSGGEVIITGKKTKDGIAFYVIDNGQGIQEEAIHKIIEAQKDENYRARNHMGIINVDKKIKLCCGQNYGISIESHIGAGTIVTINLDYRI